MKISKQDKVFLYDYLCEFENEIKQHFGCYDFNDKKLQRFLFDHDIYIDIIKQIERKSSNTNIIYYLNKKSQRVNVMMWFTIFFVMCVTLSLMAMLSKVEGINYVSMILV